MSPATVTKYRYVGLTPAQLEALFSVLAVVLNDPGWVHAPGQIRALRGALTALSKARIND